MFERIKQAKERLLNKVANGVCLAQVELASVDSTKRMNITNKIVKIYSVALVCVTAMTSISMALATTNDDPVATTIESMIDIICTVFRYVGVVLASYSIGALVMAFKNEDADSKSRATTMLVVACVLIGIDKLVDKTGIKTYLTTGEKKNP